MPRVPISALSKSSMIEGPQPFLTNVRYRTFERPLRGPAGAGVEALGYWPELFGLPLTRLFVSLIERQDPAGDPAGEDFGSEIRPVSQDDRSVIDAARTHIHGLCGFTYGLYTQYTGLGRHHRPLPLGHVPTSQIHTQGVGVPVIPGVVLEARFDSTLRPCLFNVSATQRPRM